MKFQETRNIKSKRIRQVLNRTFNPSVGSDSEHVDKTNKKEKKSNDETPIEETKQRRGRNKKRLHSTEVNSKELEEREGGVNRPKRAKEGAAEDVAHSFVVSRCKGSNRGRGRGRGRKIVHRNETGVKSAPSLDLTVEITPLELRNQGNSFQVSQKNHKPSSCRGRNQRAFAQPSTSAKNETEGSTASLRVKNANIRNKQRSNSVRHRDKNPKNLAEQDNSSSDSTDSDEDEENIYSGPKPVSVFCQGRGRGKGNERGRGKIRVNLAEQETSSSESTDSEDNKQNFYAGPKPKSVLQRGRGKGRGRGTGRGKGNLRGRSKNNKNLAERETSSSSSTDGEDNEQNGNAGPKSQSVFHRGRNRGRGKGRGRGR